MDKKKFFTNGLKPLKLGAFSTDVIHQIYDLFEEHKLPSLPVISEMNNLTCRSIQLHLKDEGNTYGYLLRIVRQTLVRYYLIHTNFSMGEIAELIKYSDMSVLSRNFKTWQGVSPTDYRKLSKIGTQPVEGITTEKGGHARQAVAIADVILGMHKPSFTDGEVNSFLIDWDEIEKSLNQES